VCVCVCVCVCVFCHTSAPTKSTPLKVVKQAATKINKPFAVNGSKYSWNRQLLAIKVMVVKATNL
jgi:hypothetical protein